MIPQVIINNCHTTVEADGGTSNLFLNGTDTARQRQCVGLSSKILIEHTQV